MWTLKHCSHRKHSDFIHLRDCAIFSQNVLSWCMRCGYQKAGIFWSIVFALCEQWHNSLAQLRYFLQNVLSWSVSEVCIRRSEFSNQFPASYLFLAQLATNWRRAHSQTRVATKLKSIFTNFLPSGTFIWSFLTEKWKNNIWDANN